MSLEYPKELVHRYGAKAGILMYVARELPEIPQAAMIVSEPGESTEDLLKRADAVPILYPRLFRSSAVAELNGYEGVFPTKGAEDFAVESKRITNPNYWGPYRTREAFDQWIKDTVDHIRTSPRWLEQAELVGPEVPDEINVIIAERSPSQYVGTLIKHPNQDSLQLMTLTNADTIGEDLLFRFPARGTFSFRPNEGIRELKPFSEQDVPITQSLIKDLEEIAAWHDRIASLAEMDPNWTYQIEFGADPPCLYQIRPFKPVQHADFNLRRSNRMMDDLIVIGVTAKEGLNVRAEVYNRIHSDQKDSPHDNPDNQPSLFYGPMKLSFETSDLRNHQANMFSDALGFLAHRDIAAMRRAQVTLLSILGYTSFNIQHGDWVNIVSDGVNVRIKNLNGGRIN